MDVSDAIKKRRSIRKYEEQEKVSLHALGEIIDLAKLAPSSGNLQNWRIVVVTEKDLREKIAAMSLKQMWMASAPVLLVICNDTNEIRPLYGERGVKLYGVQNCANIAMSIILLARERDLDTCWVGAFDNEAVQRLLEIPDGVEPEIIIAIGYGLETKLHAAKRRDLSHFCFFEKWGKREKKR